MPKVGHGFLAWRKAASIREVLRSPSPDGVSSSTAFVEVSCENYSTELEAEVLDEKQQRDAHQPPFLRIRC